MSATFFTLEELGLQFDDDLPEAMFCAEDDVASDPCVLEINDLATLAELQPLWNELIDKTPQPSFCQTFEWLQLYWQHFGEQQRLRAFCLDDAGATAGLTVLVERSTHGQRELTLPSVGGETFLPLGANPAEQWGAVARHLQTEIARKSVLDLRGLPDPLGKINDALLTAEVHVQSTAWSGATSLPLTEDFERLWSQASASIRNLIEMGEQRLAAIGPTSFVRCRPQETDRGSPHFSNEIYQDCLNIALNDEQQLSRADSVLNAPERHSFLRDLLPWAWRHSAADLCLLMSGSRPIAFRFHTLAFGHLKTVWTGVDAEFRQLPLAALLLVRTLRDSCQRGDKNLDLGPCRADVARDWHGTLTPLHRFVVGTPTVMPFAQLPEEMNLYGH